MILDDKEPDYSTIIPIRRAADDKRPLLSPEVSRHYILKAVEAVQPYADTGEPPDPPILHPLWALHRLNIIDKHRLLVVVVHTLDLGETYWGSSGDEPTPTLYDHHVAVRENGTAVASFDFHGQRPPPDFPFNTALHLVINELELPNLTRDSVENFLDGLIFHIEHMLTVHFAPLFSPGTARTFGRIRPVTP